MPDSPELDRDKILEDLRAAELDFDIAAKWVAFAAITVQNNYPELTLPPVLTKAIAEFKTKQTLAHAARVALTSHIARRIEGD